MHEYRLSPPSPFSFERTASLLSPGADDAIDVFDGKRYTRLLDLDGRMRLALVSSLGAEQRPELIITLMNGTEQDERPISRLLSRMMGMDQDLSPFYERCRSDPHLYGLSRDHYGLKAPQRPGPFEALCLAIASLPGSKHFFRASLSSLAERFSYNVAYAGHTFCAFPDSESLAVRKPKDLADGSITAQQADQLNCLATAVESGDLDLKALSRRPLDTLMSELQCCKGIGPLGAQLTALTGYGRLDCFPSADSAVRRWIGRNVFETDEIDEQRTREWAEPWGDLRGYVAIYIYAELLKKGEI
jgi:DNA-3-methyladenine glycosylase II